MTFDDLPGERCRWAMYLLKTLRRVKHLACKSLAFKTAAMDLACLGYAETFRDGGCVHVRLLDRATKGKS